MANGSDASGNKQDPNRATQSRLHKQVADLQRRLEQAEEAKAAAEGVVAILRENGATDENVDFAKKLASREAALAAKQEAIEARSRDIVIESLSTQFGIPAEELEGLSDPREMRLAAREWALEHKSQETGEEAAEGKTSTGGESKASKEPPPPPPEEKPEQNSGFDLGVGSVAGKSIANMTAEEFAAHEQKVDATITTQASRR